MEQALESQRGSSFVPTTTSLVKRKSQTTLVLRPSHAPSPNIPSMMEQLFAVRVLVHYHDKSNVDHAAVRRLLTAAAVDSLLLLLTDGTSVPLASYIQTPPSERKPIAEVTGSSGSSLTQVASVFMLAEARAAADALPSSPHELETACSALERLLGCLATRRPLLPVRDIKQSARVKFGTAARRRAVRRLSRSGADSNNQEVSILKAVNVILRLCDVATHCLAVVSRQSVSSKSSCETAVALSTRLLTLAASLYEVQKVDTAPALSFFSSNSLRTALVAGAMHLGAIAIEQSEIEPMTWIHVANQIVMSSSTSVAPKTSVLSALFGGMIKAGKRYESSERDSKAAEGAVCLLSTLHVVLETDNVRDSQDRHEASSRVEQHASPTQSSPSRSSASPSPSLGTGAISQAARSFLGERVVAAEEDGDEGRIAARTVYQACEEYAARAGEGDGMMGLLARLFASAGRQCRLESADETVVSISESTLTMQPDESDASSDGPHARPESPPFTLDVFDQRSKDGFGAGATVGSTSEAGGDHAERVDLHREVGALALDTLAHWVGRAQNLRRYTELDMTLFIVNICKSASFFSLSNSSASYDLRAAMVDFGSLIGPTLSQELNEASSTEREAKWASLVFNLVSSYHRMNPILRSIMTCNTDIVVIRSLLQAFLERKNDVEACGEQNVDYCRHLPVESLLVLLISLISEENSLDVVDALAGVVKKFKEEDASDFDIAHRASCLVLLSHSIFVTLGVRNCSDRARVAFAALYNRDVENMLDPIFPNYVAEEEQTGGSSITVRCSQEDLERLVASLRDIPHAIDKICFLPSMGSWESLSKAAAKSREGNDLGHSTKHSNHSIDKLCYHMFWSCLMLHKALEGVGSVSFFNFHGLCPSTQDPACFPLSSPFVCMKAMESQVFNTRVMEALANREQPSPTVLYTAECLALLHPQSGNRADEYGAFSQQGLPSLFTSLVKNAVDLAADWLYDDVTSNFKALQKAFRTDAALNIGGMIGEEAEQRLQIRTGMTRSQACFACLQLAMAYTRDVGTDQMPQLLAAVMVSSTLLLDRLTQSELLESKFLMLEVAKLLLFLPDSLAKLARTMFGFLKRYLSLTFPPINSDGLLVDDLVMFLARISGLSKIVEIGSSSSTGIHLLCRFAREIGSDSAYDSSTLEVSLLRAKVSDKFGSEVGAWLNSAIPPVSLRKMLSMLLVPQDESAVAVSAHAQSLALLTEACEGSQCWRQAVLNALNDCILDSSDRFGIRLVRRSVMQSATMNESILKVFERIVGTGETSSSSSILHALFLATCQLFEEESGASLESRVRLLNFAVRLSISYGRISRKSVEPLSPPLLEPALFEVIVDSLDQMTATLQAGTRDPSAKQTVLFLCSIIDCFLIGIYGTRSSYFPEGSDDAEVRAEPTTSVQVDRSEEADVDRDDDQELVSGTATDVNAPAEDAMSSSLCTYTTTGSQFVEQHWYFCYTCELAGSEGVCSVCARVCHKGCELAYSKFSRFFCDCGAGSDPQQENTSNVMSASEDGEGGSGTPHDAHSQALGSQSRKRKSCKCLKSGRRKESIARKPHSLQDRKRPSVSSDQAQDMLSGTQLRELLLRELKAVREQGMDSSMREGPSIQQSFESMMKSARTVSCLIRTGLLLAKELDASHHVEQPLGALCDVHDIAGVVKGLRNESMFSKLPRTAKIAQCTRVLKSGALDVSGLVASPDKPELRNGSIISFSSTRNVIAIGHKAGFVEFIDASDVLLHSGNPLEKSLVSDFCRVSIPFDVVAVRFHPENANLLLVTGIEKLAILSRLHENGNCCWNHLGIELGLAEFEGFDGHNALLDATWIEGEPAAVLVTTANFVKIFDAATDTFCPRFYARTPGSAEGTTALVTGEVTAKGCAQSDDVKRTIVGAIAVPRLIESTLAFLYLVFLVTSDCKLFISRSRWDESTPPKFSFFCDVYDKGCDGDSTGAIVNVCYLPSESLISVAFESGNVLCISIAVHVYKDEIQASIRWMHHYKDAIAGGRDTELTPVQGRDASFMFCRKGQTLKAGGVLTIAADRSLKVHSFSGSPSASVLGLTTYAPSPLVGQPAFGGGFLVLDDGSLHRVDVSGSFPRSQISEQSIFSTIVERQRLRALKLNNPNIDTQLGYSAIPEPVGFFEKCRLVADQVSIEGMADDRSDDANFERMGVTLAGGGGDCVVSPKEDEPFKFVASVDNRSIVLVGARLRFGGTDRSRNRVPAEVKVFGRTVRWQSRNGIKRWLDIPFSVPESTESPHKVTFELLPRRALGENRVGADGFVAVDSLELYAVSSIEFTERKLLYENEKAEHYEGLKKRKESSENDSCKRYPNLLSCTARTMVGIPQNMNFTQDQAALLTVLHSIDSGRFASELGSDSLLLEINNLWSAVFEGSPSRDPCFLDHLLRPCLGLCTEIPESELEGDVSSTAKDLLTKGAKNSIEGQVKFFTSTGILLHLDSIERSLFAVAGLARSLLGSGCSVVDLKSELWIENYKECMPSSSSLLFLLQAHLALGSVGRSFYKSSYGASGNVIDIFMAQRVMQNMQGTKTEATAESNCLRLVVEMLSSLDQRLRLFTGQRLLELFDCPETAAEITGSPFESLVATSLCKRLKDQNNVTDVPVPASAELGQGNEDSDSAQRWAYRCDSCGEVCDQEWWHCNECEDFDLCTSCLRQSNLSCEGPHTDDHLLLRGTVNDDISEQDGGDGREKVLSDVYRSVQETISPLVDEFLNQLTARKDAQRSWRFLDGAETIAQLVGRRSPPDLRLLRLKALFSSSFARILLQESEAIGHEIESSVADHHTASSTPRNSAGLFLLLRIIICAQGSTTPAYIHAHSIPSILFRLLEKMHRKLQLLVRTINSGQPSQRSMVSGDNLMSWSTWNSAIPGLSYDVLPQKSNAKHVADVGGLFRVVDELGEADSVFLNLLIATLEVLEYSFKAASSSSISEQMQQLPQNVLCDIINFCESTYSHLQDPSLLKETASAATRVLSALSFDDPNALNGTLDKYLYEEQSARLKNVIDAQEGRGTRLIEYNTAIEVASILDSLHTAAGRHPGTWRSYIIDQEEVLQNVFEAAHCLEGQIRVNALQLLAAGVAVSPDIALRAIKGLPVVDVEHRNDLRSEESLESQENGENPSSSDGIKDVISLAELMRASRKNDQVSLSIFKAQNFRIFRFLVHDVLLKSQNKQARSAASHVLILGLARAAGEVEDESFITAIHSTLMTGVELMPYAGDLADGLMHCLRFFITCCQSDLFGMQSETLLASMTVAITSLLKLRCGLLVSHPNARLYGRLSGMLDINGYYLESDPCMSCSASICESSERKECRLDTIRAETKYTDSSIMHRLLSIHEVSAISVKVIDPRRSRRAKTIDVLYSSRTVSDAAELKSSDHPWRKLRALELGPTATEACVDLVVPVATANIKLEFVDFHSFTDVSPSATRDGQQNDSTAFSGTTGNNRRSSNAAGVNENLQCPRCSRSVTDRHGICRNCHENAYQCRQCRNINYENLDGFLCNECGYCKHGRFEFSVTGRPTFVAEHILNEEDRKRASKIIEKETGNVHRCMDQLTRMRSSLIRSLNSGIPTEETKEKTRLLGTTRMGLADLLDSVAPRSDIAVLEALLEGQATHEIEEAANSTQGGISITEEVIAESSGSADPSERDQNNPASSSLASPMNRTSRHDQSRNSVGDTNIISKTTAGLATTYAKECRSIYTTMSRGIRVLTLTRAELVRYANTVGGSRLQYANDIAFESVPKGPDGDLSQVLNTDIIEPSQSRRIVSCYGCTQSFISKCVVLVQTIVKRESSATSTIQNSDLAKDMMLVCSLCEKPDVRNNIRELITYLVNENSHATQLVCKELARKIEFCIDSFETVDAHSVARFEMAILEATATLDDSCWEERLRLVIRILFKSSNQALTCSSVAESIILPCLRVALRLMRADSDLTVIESTSAAEGCGSATDGASNEGLHLQASEHSETENDDLDHSTQGFISRGTREGDVPQSEALDVTSDQMRRTENSEDTISLPAMPSNAFSSNSHATHIDSHAAVGTREQLRIDERRQNTQRGGSEFVSGSGAPSSIGTAFDGHISDDEVNGHSQRHEPGIDIRTINNMLESDHDSKLLSADVGQWLEGKVNQSSWIAEMKERSAKYEQKEKSIVPADSSIHPSYLKVLFQRWRRLCHESQAVPECDPCVTNASSQHLKRLSIEKDNWIVRLMLFTPCATVRKEACALLELLCGHEETLQLQLLDVLTGPALSLGADVGENSKEYFDLLEATLSSRNHRLYLIAKGFLPRLAGIIRSRAEQLILSEANAESSLRLVNFLEGYSLKRLLSLLRQTLEAIPSQRVLLREKLFKVDNYKLVWSLQRAYVCVRKLISLRTRLTDDCGSHLCEVLLSREFLFTGPTVSAVVSACVSELKSAKERNDAQAIAILLEQLCQMLCPERKEPICYLALNKAPTQEEFIRGSMSRNPYPSSSFEGPLMRDVKNKICKDLDLPGLLEDDFAMELLVAGNLVKLDLPIMAVFDHVWRGSAAASMASSMQPTQITRTFGLRRASHAHSRGNGNTTRAGGIRSTILTFRRINTERESSEEEGRLEPRTDPPMVVVYRLSGLDGEATEPIVDSVPVETNDDQDAEDLYGDTIVFGEVGGLDILFELLAIVGSWGDDAETAVRAPALRLLRASCEVAQNRALLAKSADAVRTLLECAASAFEHAQGSPTAVTSAESLLIAAEQILAQQRKELESHTTTMSDTVTVSSHDPEEVMSRVRVFLGRLSMATSPKAENSILHLLPFLIQGVPAAIDAVLKYFHFSCDGIEDSDEEQRKAKQLGTVVFATPNDLRGDAFAEQTIRTEVGVSAVEYIIRKFPVPRSQHKAQWEAALDCSGPPLILRLLTGLSLFLGVQQGEQRASVLLREILKKQARIIPVLCQLEMAVSSNAIGTTAEELLEALGRDPEIKKEIEGEREAIKKARREAAKASRLAILRETGLAGLASAHQESDLQISVKTGEPKASDQESVLQLMEDLPDEVGPSCVVCRDGFRCRPEDALAFYVYCRKVPLELSAGSSGPQAGKSNPDAAMSSLQGSARVELELWSSGRSRNSNGLPSRSGTNSCYVTVTHLNAIHLSCHKEAARGDRTSRRDEWDGASLRNSQTRCNNLFPVRPPVSFKEEATAANAGEQSVIKSAKISYAAAVDSYFGRLSSLGRTSLSHAKAVTYDIGRSLLRFADGGSSIFSEHSKGGGPHSNACLLPHLVQLAIYMVEVSPRSEPAADNLFGGNNSLQTQEAALAKFLNENEIGDITYYMASALVLQSLVQWEASVVAFLRRGLRDKALKSPALFRLIAFSDLVNRALKSNIVVEIGEHWLDALRKHIGDEETFALHFGDSVNEKWEEYIRNITDTNSFLAAIARNGEIGCNVPEDDVDEKKLLDALRQCASGWAQD